MLRVHTVIAQCWKILINLCKHFLYYYNKQHILFPYQFRTALVLHLFHIIEKVTTEQLEVYCWQLHWKSGSSKHLSYNNNNKKKKLSNIMPSYCYLGLSGWDWSGDSWPLSVMLKSRSDDDNLKHCCTQIKQKRDSLLKKKEVSKFKYIWARFFPHCFK